MPTLISLVLLVTYTITFNVFPSKASELKTYIVHLDSTQGQHFSNQLPDQLEEWYHSFLSKIGSRSNENPEMVYAYHHVFPGFAAKMTSEQVKMMEKLSGVASVRNEQVYEMQTTRSPHFLGLRQDSGLWKDSNQGKGIIIGLLDGGITPGHPSFHDEGVPTPPSKWKGKCEEAGCNNKLIGMKNFPKGSSEVDEDGHGTHTSSTAAGNLVDNANVFGMANGTASGMAPLAHVAMYKVCDLGCMSSDIVAGMDAAIGDGVDVLSISLGGPQSPFHDDIIAIAAFTASSKGIVVSCSAGNYGPYNTSLSNEAPWILTVGASTIDRRIRTTVYLGNGKFFDGESIYQPNDFNQKLFRPLVYPGENGIVRVATCMKGYLDKFDVKGKVVLCDLGGAIDDIGKGEVVKEAGGAAKILVNVDTSGESIAAEAHVLPASYVGYKEGVKIKKYLNSTSSNVATIIFKGTIIGLKSDPQISDFTSRGPCFASPGILKPDITGPGVDILAAWHKSIDNMTETKATFNFMRGTSMSCPHLAGVAALLKNAHPEWSPASIKSAMMTTASQVNRKGKAIIDEKEHPADVHAMGAGHVNPPRANDPGLIFDIQPDDYIPYLCGLEYTPKQISMIVKKHVSCSKIIPEAELNYPSFVVYLKRGDNKTYSRTVTNVGNPNSTYTIRDSVVPRGVSITVGITSQQLIFTALHQKITYTVTFSRDIHDDEKPLFGQGHMTWESGQHTVRTPFSFKFE